MGDFNLDAGMEQRLDYPHKAIYERLVNFALDENLIQIVDFNTCVGAREAKRSTYHAHAAADCSCGNPTFLCSFRCIWQPLLFNQACETI